MFKKFYSLEEMSKYYDSNFDTYSFQENGEYFDVIFMFDLVIDSNINCGNLIARNIDCKNISAIRVEAYDIRARNIYALGDIDALFVYAINIYYASHISVRNGFSCERLSYEKITNW